MAFTKRELELTALKIFDERKPGSLNKYNVLGGRGSVGAFEVLLNVTFTPQDRAAAGRAINELQASGHLEPDYAQMMNAEEWLKITELGERALTSGALDQLDELLLGLGLTDDLLAMRAGAHDAVAARVTDWERHAAVSSRELVTKVLHTVAPDAAVRADSHFIADASSASGITRKERIRHYLRTRDGSTSAARRAVIEKACDLVEACYNRLSGVTHADVSEVENLIKLTEEALYFLLK